MAQDFDAMEKGIEKLQTAVQAAATAMIAVGTFDALREAGHILEVYVEEFTDVKGTAQYYLDGKGEQYDKRVRGLLRQIVSAVEEIEQASLDEENE